jgi:hypothetical protein
MQGRYIPTVRDRVAIEQMMQDTPLLTPKEPPVIEQVSELDDRLLRAYLTHRAIPFDLGRAYLKQVAYRVGRRGYRALGFKNDLGGYELRNADFKGTIGVKALTHLPPTSRRVAAASPDRSHVVVFEGFFDFLSALAHYGRDSHESDVIVLNGVGQTPHAIERIAKLQMREVTAGTARPLTLHAYLDNDTAGKRALESFSVASEAGTRFAVLDHSNLYAPHDDVNAFLQAKAGQGIERRDTERRRAELERLQREGDDLER